MADIVYERSRSHSSESFDPSSGYLEEDETVVESVDYKLLLFGLLGWILFRLRITINFSIIVVECCIFRGSSVLGASDYERSQ